MIKAVFFDWFSTLADYDPPRAQLQAQVLRELGFNVDLTSLQRALILADKDLYAEFAESSLEDRTPEARMQTFVRHQQGIMAKAGINADTVLAEKAITRLRELNAGRRFALYDDVIPTVRMLKERRLTIGLLTNIRRGIHEICQELELEPYLDFIISPAEAGADKPNPAIFQLALDRGGVEAGETIYVGDQYLQDVVGARNVGITPILIDRYDVSPEFTDAPRILDLSELAPYLE
ncbi:MAG: HAD-IA family hydrolase [Dehalococcoidales bacterium]|nr:MAG: HAD-IA family hydrolase [Dehalococcoidales bacterium]